ncbi:FAD binding domain-containing protein [Spirillospora sp. CA-255316]
MPLVSSGWVARTQRAIPPFVLHRPGTVAEAVAEGAVYAQGCTDLFAQFREGLGCASLVSLEGIAALRRVERQGAALAIGAGVDHHRGAGDPVVRAALPSLAEAWGRIATQRIRRRAILGGDLMARRPRYEMSIMLDALAARLRFATPDGEVALAPADLWDRREPHGALLHTVGIEDVPGVWFGYDRSLRPLMTAAVAVRGSRVRLSVGSEYRRPYAVEADLGDDPAEGAAVMGLGLALFEEMRYDGSVLLNGEALDYRVPLAEDLPERFVSITQEQGHGPGPFGAKGAGEGAMVPVAAAIANAVHDATGGRISTLPLSPERVFTALRERS